jgi:glutathione S-transferase
MKTLYDMTRSGNCYKVRLLLALLGEDYERVPVDLTRGEQRQASFLALNPRGEIPVLVEEGQVIWDSGAILVYLATRAADRHWFPDDALARARVAQWMAVAANEIHHGLAAARAIRLFGRAGDLAHSQALGRRALALLDQQLTRSRWLAGDEPSIADIACYAYVLVAEDGDIALAPYRNLARWCRDIEALPGYVPMVVDPPSA